jgi:hypothetical protein
VFVCAEGACGPTCTRILHYFDRYRRFCAGGMEWVVGLCLSLVGLTAHREPLQNHPVLQGCGVTPFPRMSDSVTGGQDVLRCEGSC